MASRQLREGTPWFVSLVLALAGIGVDFWHRGQQAEIEERCTTLLVETQRDAETNLRTALSEQFERMKTAIEIARRE